jgi:hypothetical protein
VARTYYAQILSWAWDVLVRDAKATIVEQDGERIGSTYLGSVLNLAPSGKYYMPWTTNQTARDEDMDARWFAALDKAASKHGGWIASGEGDPTDLYFCLTPDESAMDGAVTAASVTQHTEGN